MITKIPPSFESNVKDLHGEAGELWLANLPALIEKYAEKWNFKIEESPLALTYNFVIPVRLRTGLAAVFKVGFPGQVLDQEIRALQCFNGHGAVKLLKSDGSSGALLLEKVEPGTSLQNFSIKDDAEGIEITANVISTLHGVGNSATEFPTLKDRLDDLHAAKLAVDEKRAPFDLALIASAIAECQRLLDSTEKTVLLHGDLHPGNILRSGENWLAIDPQGVIGDPCFEVAAFIRNPSSISSTVGLGEVLVRRMDLFSELLGLDRNRVWGWCFVQTLVSAWWVYSDHGDGWQDWNRMSQVFWDTRSLFRRAGLR